MPSFRVDYSYDAPAFASFHVDAEDLQAAELIARNKLEDLEISFPMIEVIEEVKV